MLADGSVYEWLKGWETGGCRVRVLFWFETGEFGMASFTGSLMNRTRLRKNQLNILENTLEKFILQTCEVEKIKVVQHFQHR